MREPGQAVRGLSERFMNNNPSVPSFTYNTWSTSATVTDVRTSNLKDEEQGEKGTFPSSLWDTLPQMSILLGVSSTNSILFHDRIPVSVSFFFFPR